MTPNQLEHLQHQAGTSLTSLEPMLLALTRYGAPRWQTKESCMMSASFLAANGERPLHQHGTMFSLTQCELIRGPDILRYPGTVQIGLIELANGRWLASPDRSLYTLTARAPQYPNREAALRAAVLAVIGQARRYRGSTAAGFFAPQQDDVRKITEWALGLVGRQPPPAKPHTATASKHVQPAQLALELTA